MVRCHPSHFAKRPTAAVKLSIKEIFGWNPICLSRYLQSCYFTAHELSAWWAKVVQCTQQRVGDHSEQGPKVGVERPFWVSISESSPTISIIITSESDSLGAGSR